jgi:hypothetical protein
MKQFRGVQRYINLGDCDSGNFPATVPTASATKSGTPSIPPQPPTVGTGVIENLYIDQATQAAINYSNMKVGYFKIDLNRTMINMYGESVEKWYYPPVEVKCLIDRGEFTYTDTEYGPDINQNIKIIIPRLNLEDLNFTPEVGDIITDQEKYYQVNTVDRSFITIPGAGDAGASLGTPGQIILFTLNAYLTRTTTLNLIKYS